MLLAALLDLLELVRREVLAETTGCLLELFLLVPCPLVNLTLS